MIVPEFDLYTILGRTLMMLSLKTNHHKINSLHELIIRRSWIGQARLKLEIITAIL